MSARLPGDIWLQPPTRTPPTASSAGVGINYIIGENDIYNEDFLACIQTLRGQPVHRQQNKLLQGEREISPTACTTTSYRGPGNERHALLVLRRELATTPAEESAGRRAVRHSADARRRRWLAGRVLFRIGGGFDVARAWRSAIIHTPVYAARCPACPPARSRWRPRAQYANERPRLHHLGLGAVATARQQRLSSFASPRPSRASRRATSTTPAAKARGTPRRPQRRGQRRRFHPVRDAEMELAPAEARRTSPGNIGKRPLPHKQCGPASGQDDRQESSIASKMFGSPRPMPIDAVPLAFLVMDAILTMR